MPDALPHWEPGTVAVLSTGGEAPHAIPVSAFVPAGPHRVLLGLAKRRESLARLRSDPRCALTLLAGGDVSVTVHATARIVAEPMAISDGMVAVALDVESVQDHGTPNFEIDAGVAWHWTDDEAAARDARVREALGELAAEAA